MSTTNCMFGPACYYAHFGKYHFESNDCADGFKCPYALTNINDYKAHMKDYYHGEDAGSKPSTAPPPKAKTPKKVKTPAPAAKPVSAKQTIVPGLDMAGMSGFNRRPSDTPAPHPQTTKSPRVIYQPQIVGGTEMARSIKTPSPRDQLVNKVVVKGVASWSQRCQGMDTLPPGQYMIGPHTGLLYDVMGCREAAEEGYTHCAKHKGQVTHKGLRKSGH